MKIAEKLKEYCSLSPFGEDGDISEEYVKVYAGPYLITIRNTSKRKAAIVYHDLHHMLTGYNNSRIGEGEAGAWELGTGCWNRPIAVLYNLGGMATGLCYSRKRIKKAFMAGCRQNNLYDFDIKDLLEKESEEIECYMRNGNRDPGNLECHIRYYLYCTMAYSMLPFILVLGFIDSKSSIHA